MTLDTLSRLYYSKRPNQKEIPLAEFSDSTADDYLRIFVLLLSDFLE